MKLFFFLQTLKKKHLMLCIVFLTVYNLETNSFSVQDNVLLQDPLALQRLNGLIIMQ